MEETVFAVGDVVELISGGPWMTVVYLAQTGEVGVAWFSGTTVGREVFPPAALRKRQD